MLKLDFARWPLLFTSFIISMIVSVPEEIWAKNPFNRNRPIAPMHFLTHRFEALRREIEAIKNQIKQLQLDPAENQLNTITAELEKFDVGENRKARLLKEEIQRSLQHTKDELKYSRFMVKIDKVFSRQNEFSWQDYAEADFATVEGNQLGEFLATRWNSSLAIDRCKLLWLQLVRDEISELKLSLLKEVAKLVSSSVQETGYRDRGRCLVALVALELAS